MRILPGMTVRLTIRNGGPASTFALYGGVVTDGGDVVPLYHVTPSIAPAGVLFDYVVLPCGQLVGVSLEANLSTFRLGDAIGELELMLGTGVSGQRVALLCQGYLGVRGSCSWLPNYSSSLDPAPLGPITVAIANPAAGAEWTWSTGYRRVQRLVAVVYSLATSAALGTRLPGLRIVPPTGPTYYFYPVNGVVPTSSGDYILAPSGTPEYVASGRRHVPVPSLTLEAGTTVGTLTTAIDAGDQFSLIGIVCVPAAVMYSP